MSDAPSQSQDKFIVRLPDGMRERIKIASDLNRRSMNAEIVDRLEKSFVGPESEAALISGLANMVSMDSRDNLRKSMMNVVNELIEELERRGRRL